MGSDSVAWAARTATSGTGTPRSQKETGYDTVFVGGLDGFKDSNDAEKWMGDQLWWSYAPMPQEWYFKGSEFKGKLFAKLGSPTEADTAITMIKRMNLKYEDKQIFAKIELPLEIRLVKSLLFVGKNVLVGEQNFDKYGLGVDAGENILKCGEDVVFAV